MVKIMPTYVMTTCGGVEVKLHSYLTSLKTGGDCQLHCPGRYYFPLGKPPLPTELETTNVWSKLWWSTWYVFGKEEMCISVLVNKCPYGQHFFVDIFCNNHTSSEIYTHNATLFYRGTCIQGRRHLVTAATSVQSCPYGSLCVTIKLDSAAI
jgi:hypothetical protein